MNDRAYIPSAVPADRAEVLSDVQGLLDDAADEIEAENKAAAEQHCQSWLREAEFWNEELIDSELQFLSAPLGECMASLQAAIDGDEFARERVMRSLHQIEKCAVPVAREQLEDIYGRGEE